MIVVDCKRTSEQANEARTHTNRTVVASESGMGMESNGCIGCIKEMYQKVYGN